MNDPPTAFVGLHLNTWVSSNCLSSLLVRVLRVDWLVRSCAALLRSSLTLESNNHLIKKLQPAFATLRARPSSGSSCRKWSGERGEPKLLRRKRIED